ncbi:MAG: SinI family restriction endonuclease [Phormidesmis sp.]
MTEFNRELARQATLPFVNQSLGETGEVGLVEAFIEICDFLHGYPIYLSSRSKENPPDVYSEDGLQKLASQYFSGYRRLDFPKQPATVPDEVVSIVMQAAYGYSQHDCERIKQEHQHSMSAENCVGALLERYLDSVLRARGWSWCCGNFVKAIDFVKRDESERWLALQVKNRDNSENSSSSAIRAGTTIQKWFRSFSKKPQTNWDNLPPLMQGYGLSEQGFIAFVKSYLSQN